MEVPEELMVCGFCHNTLECPKLLPCLHTVCGHCLKTKRESLTQCSSCQQPIGAVPTLPDDKFSSSLINFAKIPNEPGEEETKSLSNMLKELEIQQNGAKIDIKKLKLQSEEAGFEACKHEREFLKVKEKARREIRMKIEDLRTRFEKYLQEKESTLMEELDKKTNDEEFDSSQSVIWTRSVMGSIENKEELLEKCNVQSIKSLPKAAAYNEVLKEMKDHMSHLESSISTNNPSELQISFKYSPEIEEIFTKPVGTIEVKKSGKIKVEEEEKMRISLPPSAPQELNTTPYKNAVYLWTFPSLLPDDDKGYVVGIAWVPTDRLVLVDKWNNKLKLYRDTGLLMNVMIFAGGEPTDIVYTKGTDIRQLCLVTIPNGRLILQVAVEENNMRVSSRISTVTGYSSIAYDKTCSRLICGVCQPYGSPRIDIVSSNGTVEYTFPTVFHCPRSVDILMGVVVGCDWQRNRVLFIGRDGSVRGAYHGSPDTPLLKPVGTTLDGRGHILVADSKRNKIHIVSHTGNHLGSYDTCNEVDDPREINLISNENSAKLAISHGAGFVSIYELTDTPPFAAKQ